MTVQKYERLGKFIYTAYRHGGDVSDVHKWNADDLGILAPDASVVGVQGDLCAAFFAKYDSDDDLQANYERFVESIKAREV